MLQAANTNLFNPLVLKAHNSECQNLLFSLQIKRIKVSFKANGQVFCCTLGTNWLKYPI